MHKTAYNPTDGPMVVDEEGRVIGGRDWGTVNTTDPVAKVLLDDDSILLVDRSDDMNPDATAAFDRTDEVAKRHETVKGLDKDSLLEVAADAGIIEEGDKVGVADLREAVAGDTSVQLPSKSNRKREA